jgi:transglutaminase-like putative cysteine protease
MDFAVTIEYRFPADTVAARVLQANAKADAVVAEVIKPSMGDYEKELALHDWLVRHARYDLANFQANTVPNPEYTPYGVLVLGTGVCQSYASAFQQLADRAGLETRMVSGTGNGADHAWNQVQVDGVWYNLDVTWDDPAGAPPAHTYFNVDDRTLSADHKWDAKTAMPCTSLAANWFVRQGAVAHDLKELSARISTALAHRDTKLMAKVEVFSPARFRADVLAAVKRAATLAGISLSWSLSVDEAQGVIDATFKY